MGAENVIDANDCSALSNTHLIRDSSDANSSVILMSTS